MAFNLNSRHFKIINRQAVLDGDSFYNPSGKRLRSHPLKMLLITKETCPYCVQFAPTYAEVAKRVGRSIPVLQIESKQLTPELSQALSFRGFPTVKFFDGNGVMIGEYSGPRTPGDILRTICQQYHMCNL